MAANKLAKETFLREAMLGEALDHKNIIKVFKTGFESGVFYILMELCAGGSVEKYIGKMRRQIALRRCDLHYPAGTDGLSMRTMPTSASNAAGGRGNPGASYTATSSLLTFSWRTAAPIPQLRSLISDWPKALRRQGFPNTTRTGTVAGTPVFQPRQQIANFKYAKPDVDVWAAAASYYFMLTANLPKDIKGKDIWLAMYTERRSNQAAGFANTRETGRRDRQGLGRNSRYRHQDGSGIEAADRRGAAC